jgi:L-lactate dehydrogenase (cytochrome)
VLKGILDPADARSAIAAGGETTLLVDDGIRCGQDLVKALALGAKAALIGRPWVYALAAAGEAGLTRMLTMSRTDMTTALGLAGVPQASRVRRDVLLVDSG